MHSYYSDKYNDLNNSDYPIFLIEIASIFNELMLFDYLLENSNNEKLKFNILNSIISGFEGTVLKQTMWANYEYDLYKMIDEGKTNSSYDSISKIYFENVKKYTLKEKVSYSNLNTIASIYVPHYYYHFYVYKYAIGQLVAIYFFKQYKKEGKVALENYIKNFLSAGCSDYPLEILKKVGVDLKDDMFYEQGFEYLKEAVDQWTKLGKKYLNKLIRNYYEKKIFIIIKFFDLDVATHFSLFVCSGGVEQRQESEKRKGKVDPKYLLKEIMDQPKKLFHLLDQFQIIFQFLQERVFIKENLTPYIMRQLEIMIDLVHTVVKFTFWEWSCNVINIF
ncbi:M3 family metallopeptidase [Mycoplasmopsis cynos]|nr:M3 family metallopeptidase [Mycoplasmopsis cynos]